MLDEIKEEVSALKDRVDRNHLEINSVVRADVQSRFDK